MKLFFAFILSFFSLSSYACDLVKSKPPGATEGFYANVNLNMRCSLTEKRQKQWVVFDETFVKAEISRFTNYTPQHKAPYFICKKELANGKLALSSNKDDLDDLFKDYYSPMIQYLFSKGLKKETFYNYPSCQKYAPSFIITIRDRNGLDINSGLAKIDEKLIIVK